MGKPIVDCNISQRTLPMRCYGDTTETILERKEWIWRFGRDIGPATNAYLNGRNIPRGPHYPVPVKLQTAWYSRIWQTKPNPYSPREYWKFIQGHFKLMEWL